MGYKCCTNTCKGKDHDPVFQVENQLRTKVEEKTPAVKQSDLY